MLGLLGKYESRTGETMVTSTASTESPENQLQPSSPSSPSSPVLPALLAVLPADGGHLAWHQWSTDLTISVGHHKYSLPCSERNPPCAVHMRQNLIILLRQQCCFPRADPNQIGVKPKSCSCVMSLVAIFHETLAFARPKLHCGEVEN